MVRLVGTLTDVNDFKKAEERLLFDAVHDNLTGLPNRELFLDRMEAAFAYARSDPQIRPSVLVIDLDRFKQVNDSVGIAVGDSILLTLARRLGRLLKPQDTLARLSGDQFALIIMSEKESDRIIAFVETLRRALRAPITFNDREIFVTASMGIALGDGQPNRTEEVLKVIVANPTMIEAYKAGIPANGRPFPDGSRIAKLQWKPKKSSRLGRPVRLSCTASCSSRS